jgi:hypothetical protein
MDVIFYFLLAISPAKMRKGIYMKYEQGQVCHAALNSYREA